MDNETILSNYENKYKGILRLDKYISYIFDFAFLSLFYAFLMAVILPSATNISNTLIVVVIFSLGYLFLGLIGSLLWVIQLILERRRKFNLNLILKILFEKLSENPTKNRRNEILSYIFFNVGKLKKKYKIKNNPNISPPYFRLYKKTINKENRAKLESINKSLYFLSNSIFCYNETKIRKVYKEIGKYFYKEDYFNLYKFIKSNEKKCSEIFNLNKSVESKKIKYRVKDWVSWIPSHSKEIFWLILAAGTILYMFGLLPYPPR